MSEKKTRVLLNCTPPAEYEGRMRAGRHFNRGFHVCELSKDELALIEGDKNHFAIVKKISSQKEYDELNKKYARPLDEKEQAKKDLEDAKDAIASLKGEIKSLRDEIASLKPSQKGK